MKYGPGGCKRAEFDRAKQQLSMADHYNPPGFNQRNRHLNVLDLEDVWE